MIVVVDICYWLYPVFNSRMRRGVTVLNSEKVNWRVKVFLRFCACVQIYEFQYYVTCGIFNRMTSNYIYIFVSDCQVN